MNRRTFMGVAMSTLAALSLDEPARGLPGGSGFLIVCNKQDKAMYAAAQALKRVLDSVKREYPAVSRLRIQAYHWDVSRERAYCQSKLSINAAQLPLLAIARFAGRQAASLLVTCPQASLAKRSPRQIVD